MEERLRRAVGRWDWECQNRKFLAYPLKDSGIGAGTRLFEQVMAAGIVTGRNVLAHNFGGGLAPTWPQAACPRRDMQCVFEPLSPCAVTWNQISNRTMFQGRPRKQFYALYEQGEPDPQMNQLAWQKLDHFGLNMTKRSDLFRRTMFNISKVLINELPEKDETRPVWIKISDFFLKNETMAIDCFKHATKLYMLRPNPAARERLNEMLRINIPQSEDYDPTKTIGLPIRASDKCRYESSCLSFEDYMELALVTKQQTLPNEPHPYIFVTSESKEVYSELRDLMNDTEKSSRFPFRFILNDNDVQQGTGRFRADPKSFPNVTADDMMISALSTLQLQLGSGIVRANCCSNFHDLMGDFLKIGAGATTEIDFQCLNQMKDPRFRICCWKTGHCMKQREADLKNWILMHGDTNASATNTRTR
jgi:hypothetical protein